MIDERWNRKWLSVLGFLIAGWSASAIAQTPVLTEPTEHALIYEVGWAADWSRREGFRASGAPSLSR